MPLNGLSPKGRANGPRSSVTTRDFQEYLKIFRVWKDQIDVIRTVALLSPSEPQYDLVYMMFPTASVIKLSDKDWSLNAHLPIRYDLLIALNVFRRSNVPAIWLENALASCRFLWMQDTVDIDEEDAEVCFEYLPIVKSQAKSRFDLGYLDDRMLNYIIYPSGVKGVAHFMAFFMGD